MSKQITTPIPDSPRDQLAQAKKLYAEARAAGKSKQTAKDAAYDALPGFKEASGFGTSLGSPWARAIQAIEHDLIARAPTNGHSPQANPPQSAPPAAYSPTDDMRAYLQALDPAIGDQLTLNLHYLAWTHKKANDAAWRYVFSDNGSLAREGWRFEIIANTGACYQLRVTARPQDERLLELDRIKAQMTAAHDDFDRRMAALQDELTRLKALANPAQKGLF